MKIFGWMTTPAGPEQQSFELPDEHPIAVLLRAGNNEVVLLTEGASDAHYRRETT